MLFFSNWSGWLFVQIRQVILDLLVEHRDLCLGDLLWYFVVGVIKVFWDGFGMGLILKPVEYIIGDGFKIFLDKVNGLNVFVDVEMLEFGGRDDGELGDHIVGWGADVLQSDEIGIGLKVGHFAFGWHVKEDEFWGQVFEGFGAVEAQGC